MQVVSIIIAGVAIILYLTAVVINSLWLLFPPIGLFLIAIWLARK